MRKGLLAAATALLLTASWVQAQDNPSQNPASAAKPGAVKPTQVVDEKPITALPYTPSLDVNSMDKAADPCVDFYQYSCGGWMKNNPIPADQASWSVYGKLYQDNQRFLWGILDSLARNSAGRSANQQKIGDYFASCMDETAIEQRGRTPLAPTLAAIDAMTSARELPALLARLQLDN